jgi:hypothetical protein
VYDVTRAESFENLERIWMKEVDIYSNIEDAVKMVVANKVDLVSSSLRVVTCFGFGGRLYRNSTDSTLQYTTVQYTTVWLAGLLLPVCQGILFLEHKAATAVEMCRIIL